FYFSKISGKHIHFLQTPIQTLRALASCSRGIYYRYRLTPTINICKRREYLNKMTSHRDLEELLDPQIYSARCLLSRVEKDEFHIAGKPRILAIDKLGCAGFIALWAYSKNGQSGKFKIEGQREPPPRQTWTLKENLLWHIMGKRIGLSQAMDCSATVEIDETTADGLVKAVVPLTFHWETSLDPQPSKCFQEGELGF
ncbi:hypothetical protein N431DRAFT_521260, partial [Stipitochalara longipes BDJ]